MYNELFIACQYSSLNFDKVNLLYLQLKHKYFLLIQNSNVFHSHRFLQSSLRKRKAVICKTNGREFRKQNVRLQGGGYANCKEV